MTGLCLFMSPLSLLLYILTALQFYVYLCHLSVYVALYVNSMTGLCLFMTAIKSMLLYILTA
jgi:hypothetical protein